MYITELRRTAVRLNSVIECNVHEFLSTQCLISRCSYDILIGYMGKASQCLKWRMPVHNMVIPYSLAFLTESSSRTLPPGWTIAVTPY